MALQRALRLRKNSDFQRVRQLGRQQTSRLLSLAWVSNDQSTLRVGFVVSKRISKHAVTRNYIKRLLSEAIRPLLVDLPAGCDIVISARNQVVVSGSSAVPLPILSQELIRLLRRARLLSSEQFSEPGHSLHKGQMEQP